MHRKYLCAVLTFFMHITVVHDNKCNIDINNFTGAENFIDIDRPRIRCVSINGCSHVNQTIDSEDFAKVANINKVYIIDIQCRISEHVFDKLHRLLVVSLENALKGNLPDIMFGNNPSITKLRLPRNSIIHVPDNVFQPLRNLRYLDLSSNNISRFLASTFKKNLLLESLNVTNNSLTRIEKNIFCFEGSRLKSLYLSRNYIKVIVAGAFVECSVLSVIDVSFNFIKTSAELLDLPSLRRLDLTHNRISNLEYLVDAMIKNNISVELKNNPIECGSSLKDTYDKAIRFKLRLDVACSSGEPWSFLMPNLTCEFETESPSEDEYSDNFGTSQLEFVDITDAGTKSDDHEEETSAMTSVVVTESFRPSHDKEDNTYAMILYIVMFIVVCLPVVVWYGYRRRDDLKMIINNWCVRTYEKLNTGRMSTT